MPPVKRRDTKRTSTAKSGRSPASPLEDAATKTWRHVAQALERDVAAGHFGGTGRLPPETQLARELGLSRHTLRRAITSLVARGILRSVPHVGTFVAPRRIAFTITATSRLPDAVQAAGFKAGRRVLSQRICKPPVDVAKRLCVAARTDVVEIVLLISANEAPLGSLTFWVAADRFRRVGDLIEAAGSFRRALAQIGVPTYRRRCTHVVSRFADNIERDRMNLGTKAIVLAIDGVSVDDANEPTHAFSYVLDADRFILAFMP